MKIYLWKRLAWSQARLAEQPPCFLLAAMLQGQTLAGPWLAQAAPAGGSELPLLLMPAVGSPDSSWAHLGSFCSFSYCFQGQIQSDICRWEITWTWSLLQQQQVPDRAPQGGGTAPLWGCSSPTGCLWEQGLPVGLAVLWPAVVKP